MRYIIFFIKNVITQIQHLPQKLCSVLIKIAKEIIDVSYLK